MMSIEIFERHFESHDDEEAVTKLLGYNTRTRALIPAFEMPRVKTETD